MAQLVISLMWGNGIPLIAVPAPDCSASLPTVRLTVPDCSASLPTVRLTAQDLTSHDHRRRRQWPYGDRQGTER
jgi:hypothetical protein